MNDTEEEYIQLLKKRISDLIKEFNDCVSHQQKLQQEMERVRELIENCKRKQHLKDLQMVQNKEKTCECKNCEC